MLEKNSQATLYAQKIVYLKHGVKQGNPNLNAKRCKAKARTTGLPCRGMAIKGKNRCRLHGGKSTGAKTKEGLERCRKANFKHGLYAAETKITQLEFTRFIKQQNKLLGFG